MLVWAIKFIISKHFSFFTEAGISFIAVTNEASKIKYFTVVIDSEL